ncbi:hypothetical protein VKT23_014442 [Stygiomarasmius scandens]|uniref:Uncharacterized protein n=1 Tax=Marasmiellus scandens TaxID=2682957 RepID=A0ABR1J344_9AGAR
MVEQEFYGRQRSYHAWIDLHTHSDYQCMLPESFTVVCVPQPNPNLTDVQILRNAAFHHLPICTDADKGHVQMRDLSLEIVDAL